MSWNFFVNFSWWKVLSVETKFADFALRFIWKIVLDQSIEIAIALANLQIPASEGYNSAMFGKSGYIMGVDESNSYLLFDFQAAPWQKDLPA